jgi:hypothetical protein
MDAAGPLPAAMGFARAIIHLHLGDPEKAMDALDRMVDAHAGSTVFFPADPTIRQLAGYERYEAILRRVGSPMASTPHTAST